MADPEWTAFVKLDSDALLQQMNTLLRPASFSPVGGENTKPPTLSVADKLRLFELTTWTCKPGAAEPALELLSSVGHQLLDAHSPGVIGYFITDTGCDQILRLCAYTSGNERDTRKREAALDSGMRDFHARFSPLIDATDHTLLLPLPYSPLR